VTDGEVLLKVDRFAFTANNVTYAVVGDAMGYWNFFPAPDGWGRVPVWGFGDVLHSKHEALTVGERLFGYFPMSTHLIVQPAGVGPGGFIDASPHRSALAVVYNQYTFVRNDPSYEAKFEDLQMLLRPLFMTSFLLHDFIAENDFFGARAVILSSASSKTAFGLAFLLSTTSGSQPQVIGLTSPSNVAFVGGLGCYGQVLTYDKIQSIPSELPVLFVDMAGNGAVVSALHHHFRDNMKHSCVVGATHWEQREGNAELPGPRPEFFFAPTQVEKRTNDWGTRGLQDRFAQAWSRFVVSADNLIRVIGGRGEAAVELVYRKTLEGRAKPEEGQVLSLWSSDPT
jgi:hypothetical protein